MAKSTLPRINDCKVLEVISHEGKPSRGKLHVTELRKSFRRAFWFTCVGQNEKRGDHSLRLTTQVFLALTGCADLVLEDLTGATETFHLTPEVAVEVPPMIWRTMERFTPGAIIVVFCDSTYNPSEYIQTKEIWRRFT